jgi:hypothetical protein
MIIHTVCFTLRHESGSAEEADFLRTARRDLTGIPGVQDFTIARQTGRHSDLQFQFSMAFEDQATYTAYDQHPVHQAFVQQRWLVEVADFTEFDFVPDKALGAA